jgi:hypothetical protein
LENRGLQYCNPGLLQFLKREKEHKEYQIFQENFPPIKAPSNFKIKHSSSSIPMIATKYLEILEGNNPSAKLDVYKENILTILLLFHLVSYP